ncbi:preprotein translocase subunit SecG [candidate division WOR-3 bacterium]|nr:preprotein translocase subunit SecG [candidate division WOR-3 bacterium]MCK4527089.1 preprotein translocase subunit SecG [candidate division WOR-3 bacterium]
MLGLIMGIHVFIAILLILIILMQQTHGSGMSSVFGGGGSGSFFGGKGASPFLVKITAVLAVLFFVTSTSIAMVVPRQTVTGDIQKQLRESIPADRGIPIEGIIPEQQTELPEPSKGLEEEVPLQLPELPIQPEGGN